VIFLAARVIKLRRPEWLEPTTAAADTFSISTSIVIVGRMKGLMEVADQMQDEFQRGQPFLRVGLRIGEFGGELADLIDHASLRRAIRGNRAGW
jgi:hypothetical protein